MTLTVGSLFSGIGGLDLGLERAGMKVIWQSEIDPYACRVLAKHWPEVPNLGNVKLIDWSTVERPDLLCGGFPCQPVSTAGLQLAQADERWLWPEVARCLRHLRPRWALLENVPGLLVHAMGDVLGDLATLGYDTEWQGIPAAAVGAPHLRWRIFIVAHAHGGRRQVEREPQPGGEQGASRRVADRRRPVRELEHATACLANPQGERQERRAHDIPENTEPERRHAWPLLAGGSLRGGDGLRSGAWATEPELGRVANGVPHRVDRLRCLGNAVVPQVAEYVGRLIAAHNDGEVRG